MLATVNSDFLSPALWLRQPLRGPVRGASKAERSTGRSGSPTRAGRLLLRRPPPANPISGRDSASVLKTIFAPKADAPFVAQRSGLGQSAESNFLAGGARCRA